MIERVEVDQFSDKGAGFDLIVYEWITRTEPVEVIHFSWMDRMMGRRAVHAIYPGRNYSSLETRSVKPYDPEYETLMRLYGPGAKT